MGKLTSRIKTDYFFRVLVFSALSLAVNIAYALYNGVYGIIYSSVWFISLAVYYILISLLRGAIVLKEYRMGAVPGREPETYKLKMYLFSGIILLISACAISGVTIMMIAENRSFEHTGMLIYVAALFTTYKVTTSIINMVSKKRKDDYALRALSSIGLADALVSLLALQSAMINAFDDGSYMVWANTALGATVCVLVAALGIYMIVTYNLKTKRSKDGGEI